MSAPRVAGIIAWCHQAFSTLKEVPFFFFFFFLLPTNMGFSRPLGLGLACGLLFLPPISLPRKKHLLELGTSLRPSTQLSVEECFP